MIVTDAPLDTDDPTVVYVEEGDTVYYEEAGTEGADLGRLIPVASWRTWMTENVHNDHHGPEQEGE